MNVGGKKNKANLNNLTVRLKDTIIIDLLTAGNFR
jgi:hypothetical protein